MVKKNIFITMNTILIKDDATPKDERRKLKKDLWNKYNKRCYICGNLLQLKDCTIDHVDPLSRTGEDVSENRACCCVDCNEEKGDLRIDEYKALIALLKELDDNYILYNLRDKGFALGNNDIYVPELILPAYNLIVDIKSGFDDSYINILKRFRAKHLCWHTVVLKEGTTPEEFINTLTTGGFRNANIYLSS